MRSLPDWGWTAIGVEPVALDVGTGEKVRGYFVPSLEMWSSRPSDGPVVVHFLDSGASVTAATDADGLELDPRSLALDWSEQGYASLLVDYRGVGASGGRCDARNLPDDARAFWREALRRARGDPSRVVLRGIGVGTLAVAALLDDGARPAAAILIAPVLVEAGRVDLLESLERARTKRIVLLGARDARTTPEERSRIGSIVRSKSGRCFELDLDGVELTYAGYFANPSELEWLDWRFRLEFFGTGTFCAFPLFARPLPEEQLDIDLSAHEAESEVPEYVSRLLDPHGFWTAVAKRRAMRDG